MKFGNLYKTRAITVPSVCCIPYGIETVLFDEKKVTSQFDPSSHRKNCSSERRNTKFCGVELLLIFGPWTP